jgi:phosphomannomutase
MVEAYPSPGEINRKVDDTEAVIEAVRQQFADQALLIDTTDGLSMEFSDWRFNLRKSNTEPVIRLNLETRGDKKLLAECQNTLLSLIDSV